MSKGDDSDEMGDWLPPIDLGSVNTVTQIAAGHNSTCARLSNNTMKCWGYNWYGQLGLGDRNNRGDGANEMGDLLPALDLGSVNLAMVTPAVGQHSCVVLEDFSVKCWGANSGGRLGQEDSNHRGDEPNEMGDVLRPVILGNGVTAIDIAVGATHTCALLSNGKVKCWGINNYGQLGKGDTLARGANVGDMGDALTPIVIDPLSGF